MWKYRPPWYWFQWRIFSYVFIFSIFFFLPIFCRRPKKNEEKKGPTDRQNIIMRFFGHIFTDAGKIRLCRRNNAKKLRISDPFFFFIFIKNFTIKNISCSMLLWSLSWFHIFIGLDETKWKHKIKTKKREKERIFYVSCTFCASPLNNYFYYFYYFYYFSNSQKRNINGTDSATFTFLCACESVFILF